MGRLMEGWGGGGRQFGQNGQKLHENYKVEIFGSKQWRLCGTLGGKANFQVVQVIPPSLLINHHSKWPISGRYCISHPNCITFL